MTREYFRTQTKNIEAIDKIRKCATDQDESEKRYTLNYISGVEYDTCEVLTLTEFHEELIAKYGIHGYIESMVRWGDVIEATCEDKGYAIVHYDPELVDECLVIESEMIRPLNDGCGWDDNYNVDIDKLYVVRPM